MRAPLLQTASELLSSLFFLHSFFYDYLPAASIYGNHPEILLFLDMFGCGFGLIISGLLFIHLFIYLVSANPFPISAIPIVL
jgi:hypothetical protein